MNSIWIADLVSLKYSYAVTGGCTEFDIAGLTDLKRVLVIARGMCFTECHSNFLCCTDRICMF